VLISRIDVIEHQTKLSKPIHVLNSILTKHVAILSNQEVLETKICHATIAKDTEENHTSLLESFNA
jgi:hypothetical protein